jgi:hypothetical protein
VEVDAASLVIGALLSGMVGIGTTKLQDWLRLRATRRALGGVLDGELLIMCPEHPRGDPLRDDPRTARRITLKSLPQLLAPGVLDVRKDEDLFMELLRMQRFVEDFNERARTYDDAWANNAGDKKPNCCTTICR